MCTKVRWAYRTITKMRPTKMTLSVLRLDETRKAERISLHTAPVVQINLVEGIQELHEAIRCGSLRLRELDEEWERMRRTSERLDEEIRKINS